MWEAGCLRLHKIPCTSYDIRGTSMLAAAPGDGGPLSSLHVSDRQGWWWPRRAVKTTAGDGMLMLQAVGVSVVSYASK